MEHTSSSLYSSHIHCIMIPLLNLTSVFLNLNLSQILLFPCIPFKATHIIMIFITCVKQTGLAPVCSI